MGHVTADMILAELERTGITKMALARKLGVQHERISKWLNAPAPTKKMWRTFKILRGMPDKRTL